MFRSLQNLFSPPKVCTPCKSRPIYFQNPVVRRTVSTRAPTREQAAAAGALGCWSCGATSLVVGRNCGKCAQLPRYQEGHLVPCNETAEIFLWIRKKGLTEIRPEIHLVSRFAENYWQLQMNKWNVDVRPSDNQLKAHLMAFLSFGKQSFSPRSDVSTVASFDDSSSLLSHIEVAVQKVKNGDWTPDRIIEFVTVECHGPVAVASFFLNHVAFYQNSQRGILLSRKIGRHPDLFRRFWTKDSEIAHLNSILIPVKVVQFEQSSKQLGAANLRSWNVPFTNTHIRYLHAVQFSSDAPKRLMPHALVHELTHGSLWCREPYRPCGGKFAVEEILCHCLAHCWVEEQMQKYDEEDPFRKEFLKYRHTQTITAMYGDARRHLNIKGSQNSREDWERISSFYLMWVQWFQKEGWNKIAESYLNEYNE